MHPESHGLLRTYLRDHIAASVGGLALAERAGEAQTGSDFGEPLKALAEEIQQDGARLRQLADALGVGSRAPVKEAAAWMAEKAGRLKLNRRLVSRSPLSLVLELEGLQAAVNGKRAVWQTLLQLVEGGAPDVPTGSLSRQELQDLIARADDQVQRIAALHDQAARRVFATS